MRTLKSLVLFFVLATLLSTLTFAVQPDRIAGAIDSSQMVTLAGSIHAKAQPKYDQGPVEPSFRVEYVTLLTVPTASQQKALTRLVAEQQDRKSANYHKWLTPEQYADRFGLSQNDLQRIKTWLQAQGFSIVYVARGRNWIGFSGTAAQMESAFHTEIHRYNVDGEIHFANATPLSVPAALSGVATALRGMHDFRPRPTGIRRSNGVRPYYNSASFGDLLAPGDVKTIYDIAPLYAAGIDGTGQTLAVAGQTDVYQADLTDFRTGFGLTPISCTTNSSGVITACNTSNFRYVLTGTDPGVRANTFDLSEADLDLEWSGAVARKAQIIYVNSLNVFTSYYYAIDQQLAPVISLSYGLCELGDEGFVTADETELTKANTEGITFVNSSGDSGAAECDSSANTVATGGLAVSYPASSPEVTGVGGTAVDLANFSSTFWGTTNGTDGGTALSYVPEIAWNDDAEIAEFCIANSTNLFCTQGGNPAVPGWVPITSAATAQSDIGISSTGGGPSNCATTNGSGVCTAGFAKPAWQTVTLSGQPSVRYSPDVSFFASPNFPGFIFCTPLEELQGGTNTASSCANGISTAVETNVSIIGGTSASAPVFAGIVALLNQYLAGPSSAGLGNVNPTLYSLAKTPSNKAFHQPTSGNNMVYCQPGTPAGQPAALLCPAAVPPATLGVFGYDVSKSDATTGYNLVTGLGSVDVNNLAVAWDATRTPSNTAVVASAPQVNLGQSVTFTATVTPATAVGVVSFFNNGSTTALGTATLTSSSAGIGTFSTTALPVGSNVVTATFNGDGVDKPSTSAVGATVVVVQPDFKFQSNTFNLSPASVAAGHSATATLSMMPLNGSTQTLNFTCPGAPTGVSCGFNPTSVTLNGTTASNVTVTVSTQPNMALGAQAITVTATATGSGSTSHSATGNLTVTATDQSFTLAPGVATISVTQGGSGNTSITMTPANGFSAALTYTCTEPAALTESTCTISPSGSTMTNPVTVNVTTTAPSAQLREPLGRSRKIWYAVLLPGLLGIFFTAGSKRSPRGLRMLSLIVVLGCSTMWLGACGGGGGPKNPGTPKGSYTLTINATTGGTNPVAGQTTVTLNVN